MNCAVTVDKVLAGIYSSQNVNVAPSGLLPPIRLYDFYPDKKFSQIRDVNDLVDKMYNSPIGSRGIVQGIYNNKKPGHTFNVIKHNDGRVYFVDAQNPNKIFKTSNDIKKENYSGLFLLRTN